MIGGLALLCSCLNANDALLEVLVRKGTLTQAEADEVRMEIATETGPPPAPDRIFATPNRGTISELKIRGRIQGQYAYADGRSAGDYSSFELRRVRLGVQGKIHNDWDFLVEANLLSDVDLDSATLTYAAIPEAKITFGKAKPRFGHEENTSSASILTLERSRLTGVFGGDKPLGLSVHGDAGIFSYYAGIFNGTSTSTSRMASELDSYLYNLSAGVSLDDIVPDTMKLRLRLDYLHNADEDGYYQFEDSLAGSIQLTAGAFDLRTEYMWGETHSNGKVRGFYIIPSYYIIPKTLQAVVRYERVRASDGTSVGVNRYADRVPGSYRSGDAYEAAYLGLNYYIHGDNLKLMAGIERAESELRGTDVKGRTTTFISGVRMQF